MKTISNVLILLYYSTKKGVIMMNYQEVKKQLEVSKNELQKKLEVQILSMEERKNLQHAIDNYEYIIELTDMNHFERGSVH